MPDATRTIFKDVLGLSEALLIPPSWIYSRTRLPIGDPGRIPHIKMGKYLRFKLAEVLEWLEQQQKIS